MSEEEKWKHKYFRMRRLAGRLIREVRKFSDRCADSAEKTLQLIARGGDE